MKPRSAIAIAVVALLVTAGAVACAAGGESGKGKNAMSQASVPFSCERANKILGYRFARVHACSELLPGLFAVVLKGWGTGGSVSKAIVVEDGMVVSERGAAPARRWLQRIKVLERKDALPNHVAMGLEALGALPPGFVAEDAGRPLPGTSAIVPIVFDPFTLTLVHVGYDPARAQAGGGVSERPRLGRAILQGTADYRFTWSIAHRDPDSGSAWVEEGRHAME